MLNEENYKKANEAINSAFFSKKGLSHDDKLLVLSVISRARHLEKEVERLEKRMVLNQKEATKAWLEVERLRVENQLSLNTCSVCGKEERNPGLDVCGYCYSEQIRGID
jgi:hypothetical protein